MMERGDLDTNICDKMVSDTKRETEGVGSLYTQLFGGNMLQDKNRRRFEMLLFFY